MTDKRFNELINGPLGHPIIMFRISRLVLALRNVVEVCGDAGANALEAHCAARDANDHGVQGIFEIGDEPTEC